MSKIKRILNQDVDIHSGNGNIADENTHFHVLQEKWKSPTFLKDPRPIFGFSTSNTDIWELSRFANDPYPRPLCTRVSNITRLWNAVVKNPGKSKYIVAAFLRLHRLTILTILDPDWKEVSCDLKEDLVDNINVCCNTLANMFERALDCRRELLSLANDPWGDRGVDWNKLVYGKLKFEDQGVRNFLDSESDEVILGRIHFLVAVDREHLALNLARYLFIHHSRRRTLAFENIENSTAESENKELYDYSSLANYQAALNWLASLLQRRSLPDIIEDTMLLSCHEGILLIMCFQKRKTRDSLNIANELIKAFLVRDILYPKEYCCTKLLFQLWCSAMKNDSLLQVTSAVRELLGPTARNSAQFYLCADVFYSQFQGTFLPLYVELFIRGLTIDINFLEVLRNEKRKRQHKVNEIEIHISDMFDKFSTLFTDLNEVVERECVLSAFSLRPTKERLYILQNLTDHILSDGNFKSEWEKELNQSDPGCHKYSCGFNCSNVCMQRKKLFHPLLSKGIKNVPYSLVKDFVVVLEAVRCSTFQFDYFDWESAIKELSDYLEEYTKKSSQNRLLTDYDSDTEYASDESNSSVPHANRKLNNFKASASSSHQDVYQNGHHHEIAPISVESDCMGLPNASIPYVAETVEIETESKNPTHQSSISNSVTPNNPKPDVEIHKNHNSNLRNEDPQSERSPKNYNEDFNDPGGIVKVPTQKVISNDSGAREFSSNNRSVPVSDQNSSDSSHYPSTLPSHLLKSKSVPERYPAPSNANRQNYSQENVIQGVSLTVSSPSPQRTTNKNVSTSNISKPSHDAELCNDGSKKQFRYNNSPITVSSSSALEPLASTLEGLGSPYRLLHAMGAPNRVPEKRKLDHPVLPAGRISPFRKQLIKDPMQSYSSNKTLAGRFQHSDASVLKYVQLQCENQTSRNIVQSQTRTSQNPKVESRATTVTSLLDSCKIKTAITNNVSDFAVRSPNILRRPNIAKVSPVVNHGGQKTAAISSLVPLPKDQNKISDNKSQNFCNRNTVIQHIQVQTPDTDKQATVPQPSTPVPPLNEVKNFKPGKPLSFKIAGGAKWIRGPNGSGTPLYVKIMKPPDGKKILLVEKQTKERDGLEGNAAQSNNILKVSFTTNDKQHGSQKIVDMDINPSQLLDLFSNNSTPNLNQLPSEIICPSSSSGNLEPVNNIYSSPVTKSNSISSSSQVFNSWSGHSKQLYNSTHQSVNIPQQQKINSSSSTIQSQFSQDLTASKTDNAPSSLIKHGSFSVEQKNLECVPYSQQQQVGNSESIVNPQTTLRSLLSNPPAVSSTSYAIQKSRVSTSTTSLSSNVCTESFESYTVSSAPKQQQVKSYVERAVVSSPPVNAKMEKELPLTTSESQYVSNTAAKSVSSVNSRNVSNCTVSSSPKPQQVKTFTNAPTSSVIHMIEGTKTPVSALELQCGSTNVTSSLSNFNSRNYSNYSRSQPLKQQPNANLGTRIVPTTYGNTSKERKVTSVPDLRNTLVSASTALKSIASPQPFTNYIRSHSSEPQNSVLTESIPQTINSTMNKETPILHVEVPTLPNKKTLSSNLYNSPIESPISSTFPTNPSMHRSSLDLKPFGSDRNANPAISYGTTVMSSSSEMHSSVSNESTFSNPTTSFTNDVNAMNLSFNTNGPSPNPINSFDDNRSATNLTSYITNKHPPSPEPSVISYGSASNKTPSCSTMNGQKKFEQPRSDRTVNSPYNTVGKSNPIPASLNNDQTAVTPSYNIANKPPPSPLSFIFDDSGNSVNPYNDTRESFSDQRPSHGSNVNVMSPSSYVTNRSSFSNDSSLMSPPSYVKSRPSSNSSPFSANSNAMNPTSYSVTNNSLTQRPSFTSDANLSPPYNVKNRPSSNPSSFTYNGNTVNATSYGTTKKSSSSSASSLNCDENARSPSYNINRPASNPLPPSFSIDKKSRKYWLPERPQSLANPSVLMPPLCCSPHEVDKCQSCKQSEMDRSSEAVVSNRNMSTPSGNPALQASFHERSLYQQVKLEGQKLYPEQHVVGLSSKKRDEKITPFRCRFCGKYLKTRHTHKMHELKQHINKTPKNHKSYTIPNSDVLPCNSQTRSLLEIVKVEPPDDFEVFNSETTREKNVQFENRGELDIILDQYSANTSLSDKMLEYFSDFSEPGISDSKVLPKSNPNLISEEVLPYPKINARIPSIPEQSITDPVTVNSIEHASSKPYDSNLCSVIKSSVPQEQQDNLNLEATAYDTELQSPWQVAGAAMRYLSDPSYANIDEQFFPDFQENFDRMAEEEASFKNDPKDVPSSPYPNSTHSSMSTTVASNSSIYQKNVPTTVNNFQMNDFFQSPRNQNLMDNGNWQHIEPKYFQHNCTTCQQAFASEEALQIHINNIHGSHVQMPGQPFYPYDNLYPDTPSNATNLKTTPNYLMLRQDYDVQGNDSISESKIVNSPNNNNNNLFYRTFDDQCANIATPDSCNMLAKSPFEDSKISSNVSSDKTNVSDYRQNSLILPPNEKEPLVCEICSSRFPSYNMKQTHMEQLHGIYSPREGSREEINRPFNVYPQPTHLEKNNRFHASKSYENNQRHEPNHLPSTMLPHDENYGTNKLPQLSAERRQPEQNEHVPANHIQPYKANASEAALKNFPSRSRLTNSPLLASVLSSHPVKSYGAIGIKTEPLENFNNFDLVSRQQKVQTVKQVRDGPKIKRPRMNLGLSCPMCNKKFSSYNFKRKHINNAHEINWIESPVEYKEREMKEREYKEKKMKEKMAMNNRRTVMMDNTFRSHMANAASTSKNDNGDSFFSNNSHISTSNDKKNINQLTFEKGNSMTSESPHEPISNNRVVSVSSAETCDSPHPMPVLSPIPVATGIAYSSTASPAPLKMPEIDTSQGNKRSGYQLAAPPRPNNKYASLAKDVTTLNTMLNDETPPVLSKSMAKMIAKNNSVFMNDMSIRSGSDKYPAEIAKKSNGSQVPCEAHLPTVTISKFSYKSSDNKSRIKSNPEKNSNKAIYINVEKDLSVYGNAPALEESSQSVIKPCGSPIGHDQLVINRLNKISVARTNQNSNQNATSVQFTKDTDQLLRGKSVISQGRPPHIIHTTPKVQLVRPKLGFQKPTANHHEPIVSVVTVHKITVPSGCNTSETKGSEINKDVLCKELAISENTKTINTTSDIPAKSSSISSFKTNKSKNSKKRSNRNVKKPNTQKTTSVAEMRTTRSKSINNENDKEQIEESSNVENIINTGDIKRELRSDSGKFSSETTSTKLVLNLKKINSSSRDSKFQCYVPKKNDQMSIESTTHSSSYTLDPIKSDIVRKTSECVVRLDRLMIAEKGVITKDKIEEKPVKKRKKRAPVNPRKRSSRNSKVQDVVPSPAETRSKRSSDTKTPTSSPQNSIGECKVLLEKTIPDQFENRKSKRRSSIEVIECPKKRRSDRNTDKPTISRKDRRRSCRLKEGCLKRLSSDHSVPFVILE